MASFTITWAAVGFEDTPAGTSAAKLLDDRIRELKVAIRERTEIEHYWAGDGFDGVHKLPFLAAAARDALTDKQGQVVLSSDAARMSYRDDSAAWQQVVGFDIGDIKLGGYTTAPFGWLKCDGASLLRTTPFDTLFDVIGVLFGNVDGTHFNVPDLAGFIPIGIDTGDSTFDTIGKSDGALTVTLDETEIPAHTHVFAGDAVANHQHSYNDPLQPVAGSTLGTGSRDFDTGLTSPAGAHTPTGTNASTGGGLAHTNVQPSLVFAPYIRYL